MKKQVALFLGTLCCLILLVGTAFAKELNASVSVNGSNFNEGDIIEWTVTPAGGKPEYDISLEIGLSTETNNYNLGTMNKHVADNGESVLFSYVASYEGTVYITGYIRDSDGNFQNFYHSGVTVHGKSPVTASFTPSKNSLLIGDTISYNISLQGGYPPYNVHSFFCGVEGYSSDSEYKDYTIEVGKYTTDTINIQITPENNGRIFSIHLFVYDSRGQGWDVTPGYETDYIEVWVLDPKNVYDGHKHIAYCSQPNQCKVCHATTELGITNEIKHWNMGYTFDTLTHSYICMDCGQVDWSGVHYADCNDPDKCVICKKTTDDGIVMDFINHDYHYDWDNVQYDATEHWVNCPRCGEKAVKREHYARCDDPNTCVECGKTTDDGIMINDIYHDFDWDNYQYDATEHWNICSRCGKKEGMYSHYVSCDDPNQNTCAECGKTVDDGITIKIRHNYDWDDVLFDQEYHWRICKSCGEIIHYGTHWAFCDDNPDTCFECGKTLADGIVFAEVFHEYEPEDVQFDQNSHWWVCVLCGEIVDLEPHSFVNGKCISCDYEQAIVVRGDANGDDSFALDDIMIMIDYYCGSGSIVSANCDLDNDGAACTLADIMVAIDLYCSM